MKWEYAGIRWRGYIDRRYNENAGVILDLKKSLAALQGESASNYDMPAIIIANNQGGGKHICQISDASFLRMVLTYAINEAENYIKAIDAELAKY